jgi:iron(III) transport system ATP-binding protein
MTSSYICLRDIQLKLEQKEILKHIDFKLEQGEIACLLGPSGCGKTTLLRVIAGLEMRATGEILFNGIIVQNAKTFIKPEKRNIGMVFQDFALFPHLNVSENILLGLSHLPAIEKKMILEKMLELVKLQDHRLKYPHKLSGGQQQRVALARALAKNPTLLLLDEPFSNLDVELRYRLSEDVRGILKQLNMTAILVTHDQSEAFSFADKIAVIKDGRFEQFSDAYKLYHYPKTSFVAGFIGEGIMVDGRLLQEFLPKSNKLVTGRVLVRPDDILYDDSSFVKGLITKKFFRGSHFLYNLIFDNGLQVYSLVQSHYSYNVGDKIGVKFELDHIVEFSEDE